MTLHSHLSLFLYGQKHISNSLLPTLIKYKYTKGMEEIWVSDLSGGIICLKSCLHINEFLKTWVPKTRREIRKANKASSFFILFLTSDSQPILVLKMWNDQTNQIQIKYKRWSYVFSLAPFPRIENRGSLWCEPWFDLDVFYNGVCKRVFIFS